MSLVARREEAGEEPGSPGPYRESEEARDFHAWLTVKQEGGEGIGAMPRSTTGVCPVKRLARSGVIPAEEASAVSAEQEPEGAAEPELYATSQQRAEYQTPPGVFPRARHLMQSLHWARMWPTQSEAGEADGLHQFSMLFYNYYRWRSLPSVGTGGGAGLPPGTGGGA